MSTSHLLQPITPGAPTNQPIPLPDGSATPRAGLVKPRPDEDRNTNVSYESCTRSERSVFMRKHDRFKDWARKVTGLGGVKAPESRMGAAAGVGSAVWSDTASAPSQGRRSMLEDASGRPRRREAESGRQGLLAESLGQTMVPLQEEVAVEVPDKQPPVRPRPPLPRIVTHNVLASENHSDGMTKAAGPPSRATVRTPEATPVPSRAPVPTTAQHDARSNRGAQVNATPGPTRINTAMANRSDLRLPTTHPSTTHTTAPSPYLAPSPSRTNPSTSNLHLDKPSPPAPGDLLSPYPPSGVTRAQRDAYISSALSLPLDLLAEVNGPSARAPSGTSSRLSGVRLRSLLSQRSPRESMVEDRPTGPSRHTGSKVPRAATTLGQPYAQPLGEKTSVANIAHAKHNSSLRQSQLPKHDKPTHVAETTTSGTTVRRAAAQPLPSSTIAPHIGPNSALGVYQQLVPAGTASTRSTIATPVPSLGSRGSQRSGQTAVSRSNPAVSAEVDHLKPQRNLGSQGSQRLPTRDNRLEVPPDERTRGRAATGGQARSLGSHGSQRLTHRDGPHQQPPVDDEAEQPQHGVSKDYRQGRDRMVTRAAEVETAPRLAVPRDGDVKETVRALGSQGSQRSRHGDTLSHGKDNTYVEVASGKKALMNATDRAPARSLGSAGSQRKAQMQKPPSPAMSGAVHDRPERADFVQPAHPGVATTVNENLATHRQQRPLPRPALSRNNSSMRPSGRLLRQPSLSNIRFDPTTYPLPASVKSPEGSEVVLLSPTILQNPMSVRRLDTAYTIRADAQRTDPPIQSGTLSTNPKAQNVNLTGQTVLFAPNSNVHLERNPGSPLRGRTDEVPSSAASEARVQDSRPAAPPPPPTPITPASPGATAEPPPSRSSRTHLSFQERASQTSPRTSPSTPAIILSPAEAENVQSTDAEHLSFEVPSGHRGRLRVSLAWFRDGARLERRSRSDAPTSPGSPPPPPVPPKSPSMYPQRSFAGRVRDHFSPRTSSRDINEYHSAKRDGRRDRHRNTRYADEASDPATQSARSSPDRGSRRFFRQADRGRRRGEESDRDDDRSDRWDRARRREREREEDEDRRQREREAEMDRRIRARSPISASPSIARPAFPYWNASPLTPFEPTTGTDALYGRQGFAYPQPSMPGGYLSPWDTRPNMGMPTGMPNAMNRGASQSHLPLRPTGSRAPPSPPRPPSIDPPSDRGSPPSGPAPLPAMNGYSNGMLGVNAMAGRSAQHVGDSWQAPWADQHQQQQDQQYGQGRFSRFFNRRTDDSRGANDTGAIARWRRGVNRNDAPTAAPPFARTRSIFGGWNRQRNDENDRGWDRFFAKRRRGEDDYYGRQAQDPAPMPMSSAIHLGLNRRQAANAPRVNFGQPRYDPYEAHRRERKELRRREKMERRNRRAERSRSSTRDGTRRDRPGGMNGFGLSSMGMATMTSAPRADVQGGRYKGFKIRRMPSQAQMPRMDKPQRSGFAGFPGLRNAAWGRGAATVVQPTDPRRARAPKVVRDWADMLRPGRTRPMPTPYPQPVAKASRRDVRRAERSGGNGVQYGAGKNGNAVLVRSDARRGMSTKKWSERAKAKRRR